jgi:hypothetical protein
MLLVFYSAFNIGLVMNTHYCGGKIASISLLSIQKKSCYSCEKKQKSSNCCKDTQTHLSINDQLGSQSNILLPDFISFITIIPNSYYFVQAPVYAVLNKYKGQFYVFETGPPKTPVYIQIHSLLI